MKLRIYVIGPITYKDGGKRILEIANFLKNNSFENVFNPLEKSIDHSIDYRDRKKEGLNLYRRSEIFIKKVFE